MKNERTANLNKKTTSPFEQELLEQDAQCNPYYARHHACKKAWRLGLIIGPIVAVAFSLLIFGFAFDWSVLAIFLILVVCSIWTVATTAALFTTASFGLSWIPLFSFRCMRGLLSLFDGVSVLWTVALLLYFLLFLSLSFGLFLFALVFPLECWVYRLLYKHKRKAIKKGILKGQPLQPMTI